MTFYPGIHKSALLKGCQFFILLVCLPALLLSCATSPGPPLITERQATLREAIESYMGSPYSFGGSSYRGIDCSGFVMRVYERIGIHLPHSTRKQFKMGKRIKSGELKFGDVMFFKGSSRGKKRKSYHVGIYMEEGRFAHASKSRGVTKDSIYNYYWLTRFLGGRRFLY